MTPAAGQGKLITDAYSRDEVIRLLHHLHNENEWNEFVMGFLPEAGSTRYFKSRNLSFKTAIERSVQTTLGSRDIRKQMAYAPYARNGAGQSTFGVVDFDAHEGNLERAQSLAHAALEKATKLNSHFVILEESGRGYHLWLINTSPVACESWSELLRKVTAAVGAQIETGLCEIFPASPKSPTSRGYAIRAPGSWNPATDTVNRILFENIGPLIELLNKKSATSGSPIRSIEDQPASDSAEPSYEELCGERKQHTNYEREWARRYPIDRPHRRNQMLKAMVEKFFPQVGRNTGRRIAEIQYQRKGVKTEATREQHLKDYESLWDSLETAWLAQLAAFESERLNELTRQCDRDAFRIFLGFQKLAIEQSRDDFPIVQDSLAGRLGLTRTAVSKLIGRFVKMKILSLTLPYTARVAAARYRFSSATAPKSLLPFGADANAFVPSRETNSEHIKQALLDQPIAKRYGQHIIAVLALREPMPAADLRAKIPQWPSDAPLYEKALVHLERRLVIDVTPNGRYKLGPNDKHYNVFRAMHVLKQMAWGRPTRNTTANFKTLTNFFPFSLEEFIEARDRLLATGLLVKDETGDLIPNRDTLLEFEPGDGPI